MFVLNFATICAGNSLIDQDDDNICTSPQLGHMTGKWIRRDFNCNWKKWYEKIDPLGQSKIYNNSNTKRIHIVAANDQIL